MKWSQPSQDELEAAQELIDEFLGKELASIRDFVDGKVELKKDQLQNSLTLISGIIIGKGTLIEQVLTCVNLFEIAQVCLDLSKLE